jgi:hypothetical protein
MAEVPEPRPVERHEVTRADETVGPADDPAPVPARPRHARHVDENMGGVERHEHVVTGEAGVEHRERYVRNVGVEQDLNRLRVTQLLWLFFGIIEGLIGLRVLLKLIGANPGNAFASFVYDAAALFLAPFFGLVGSPAAGGMVLEVSSLVAMLVYALLGWVIVRLVSQFLFPPMTRSRSTYDRYPGQ